jgi:hypothetical protein
MFLVSPGEIFVPSVRASKVLITIIICPQKRLFVQAKGHCERLDEKSPEFGPDGRVSPTYAIQ